LRTMNFLDIALECNGKTLLLGKSPDGEKREFGITSITGLESSDLEVQFTDNALVDGSTPDGKRIKSRPIHIEATLRDDRNNDIGNQNDNIGDCIFRLRQCGCIKVIHHEHEQL